MYKFISIVFTAFTAFAAHARAGYPTNPIRFALVASAGWCGDAVARLISKRKAPLVEGTFYIDNRPGAGEHLRQTSLRKLRQMATPSAKTSHATPSRTLRPLTGPESPLFFLSLPTISPPAV